VTHFKVDAAQFMAERDREGRCAVHYALTTDSMPMVREVLSMWSGSSGGRRGAFEDAMFLKDSEGNIPFAHFLKQNASKSVARFLLNRFDDSNFCDLSRSESIDRRMRMIFAPNDHGEVAIVEEYLSAKEMEKMPTGIVSEYVFEFLNSIERVDGGNADLVGFCLLFSTKLSRIKLIAEKIGDDKAILERVLNVRNSSNHDALYRLVASGKIREFEWLLSEVVPDGHQSLYSRSAHSGDTTLMKLLERGNLRMAGMLMEKVHDHQLRAQLLRTESFRTLSGGGSALDTAQRMGRKAVVEWIARIGAQ